MYPTLINIKGMLFIVMVTKLCLFMTDLVSRCRFSEVQIQFTSPVKKCLKKLNIVKKNREKYLKKELIIVEETERTL